jgi:hypothetical protein
MNVSPPFDEPAIKPRFPLARETDFAAFNNRYADRSCHVIGRGPTEFDYQELSHVDEPIFFINDAVCLEKFAGGESFFFAHDPHAQVWLDGQIKSTAVLPIDGKIFRETPSVTLQHAGGIVFYHWREHGKEQLLHMNRDQLAEAKQLFTHTGTIHSLLHFVWFCGFKKITFIGCDCITDTASLDPKFQTSDGYDPRLENRTRPAPGQTYAAIERAQTLLIMLFGFEAVYLGTPRKRSEP